MSAISSHLESRLVPALMGLGAVILVLLLGMVLDFNGLYGQDSYAYVDYAEGLRAWLGGGEMPEAIFWPEGYPMAGALLSYVTGDVAVACLWLSALSVGMAVYWMLRLGRLMGWGNGAVWAVGLVLGSSPFLLRNGMMCMSDAMAVALVAGVLRLVPPLKKHLRKTS